MRNDHDFAVAYVDLSRVTGIEDVVQRVESAYDDAFTDGLRRAWHAVRRRIEPSATLGVPGVASVGLTPSTAQAGSLGRLHGLLEAPQRLHERTGSRCLIVYDEFQEMLTAQPDLDGVLRSHIQHHSGAASYLFAGSHTGMMDALFGDRRRPLFEQARAVKIGPLMPADIAEYVEGRFAAAHRTCEPGIPDTLAAQACGHPQRAMMIAHFLWEQAADTVAVGNSELQAAQVAALAEASDGLQRTWDSLSTNQRRLVRVLAVGESHPLRVTALAQAENAKELDGGRPRTTNRSRRPVRPHRWSRGAHRSLPGCLGASRQPSVKGVYQTLSTAQAEPSSARHPSTAPSSARRAPCGR